MIFRDEYRVRTMTVVFKNPEIADLQITDVVYIYYFTDDKINKVLYNTEFVQILANTSVRAIGFECEHGDKPETVILTRDDILYIKFS